MRLSLVTPPALEPVTLDEAKAHLRLQITADDALVSDQIAEAREWVESQTHLCFLTQTWDVFLDSWDGRAFSPATAFLANGGLQAGTTVYQHRHAVETIRLPHGPVQSVQFVKYYDTSGNVQTWDPSLYIVSTGNPARVAPRQNVCFPPIASQIDAVQVRYTAGYGDDPALVPRRAKAAIKLVVDRLYAFRGPSSEGALAEVPIGIQQILESLGVGANLFA